MKGLYFIAGAMTLVITGCLFHKNTRPDDSAPVLEAFENATDIVVMPTILETPAHIIFKKITRLRLYQGSLSNLIKRELSVNGNMRNLEYFALIKKNGHILRKIEPTKVSTETAATIKNANSSLMGSKLFLNIPPIGPNLEIEIITSYEWMDLRWIDPILLKEPELTTNSKLNIKIPFGVEAKFQCIKGKSPMHLEPERQQINEDIWKNDPISAGQGIKLSFSFTETENLTKSDISQNQLVQMLLAFMATNGQENFLSLFDSWQSVSRFLYEKIDRLDFPSKIISEFAKAETKGITNTAQKIAKIFDLLKSIQLYSATSDFKSQKIQPATRTLLKKVGSPYDIVILGKALLSSLEIPCEIAASNTSTDPFAIKTFPTPAVFSKVVLMVKANAQNYFFDPLEPKKFAESQEYLPDHALPINALGSDILSLGHPFTLKENETTADEVLGL